jgi:Zn-dependent peptidase ImmA (M78 family)/transcriptional regulator with XRE-family HTH domain
MAEAIPVNFNILKWARETCGLTLAEVAWKMKKSEDIIHEWEQGLSTPTYSQLEKLAYEVYKRPTAVFFFPAIPQETTPRAEFRTLPGEVVDTMPPQIIRVYKRAKVYQLNLKELDNRDGEKTLPLLDTFKITRASNIVGLAKEIRGFLHVDLQTQISWKNSDVAIEAWRNALIGCGIYVFKDAFHNDLFSGLSLYDKDYPVILINNSMSRARQIFTIFHELGHLLFKAGGVDHLQESFYARLHADYFAIEQKCNEFAGEFLLPAVVFKSQCEAFSEEAVSYMAGEFKVSREVVLRKYLNEKLITPQMYGSLIQKWVKEYLDSRAPKKDADSSGNPYNTKKAYLGAYYINLAFSRYYQGSIDIETLADYLGLKVGNVATFEGYALRQ